MSNLCMLLLLVEQIYGRCYGPSEVGGLNYKCENGVFWADGIKGDVLTDYVVAGSIADTPVVRLTDTLRGLTRPQSLVVQEGVQIIDEAALENCYNLAKVTLPSTLTRLGAYTFRGCAALRELTFTGTQSQLTTIGAAAFSGCASLQAVNWPGSTIPTELFYDCQDLASITLNEGLRSIEDRAFVRCNSLTSVTIPSSVTSMGAQMFWTCSRLTTVVIKGSSTAISFGTATSEDGATFSGCYSLSAVYYCSSTVVGGVGFASPEVSVYVPSDYGSTSFAGLSAIKDWNAYPDVTDGAVTYTFDGSTLTITGDGSLDSVVRQEKVVEVVYGKCVACPVQQVTAVVLNQVTEIGTSAFASCTGLTSLTIPSSVAKIADHAFSGCEKLASVTFEGSSDFILSIGESAFEGCALGEGIYYCGTYMPLAGNIFSSSPSVYVSNTYVGNKFGNVDVTIPGPENPFYDVCRSVTPSSPTGETNQPTNTQEDASTDQETDAGSPAGKSGSNAATIAGSLIGVLIVLAVIALILFFFVFRRNKKRNAVSTEDEFTTETQVSTETEFATTQNDTDDNPLFAADVTQDFGQRFEEELQ